MKHEVTLTGREAIKALLEKVLGGGHWDVEDVQFTLLQNGELDLDSPLIKLDFEAKRKRR